MKAFADLFSTDYGLFSAGVLVFMLGMGVWFMRFFNRKIAESAAQAQAQAGAPVRADGAD
jgi:hypothetical protein